MKTKPTLIFCFIFYTAINLFAQKPSNSLLIGSWQFNGNISCDNSSDANTNYNVISFYKNHVYQIRTSNKVSDSLRHQHKDIINIEAGKWNLSGGGKHLKYNDSHNIPLKSWSGIENKEIYIRTLNDSCLVTSYDSKENFYSYFNRISPLPIIKDNYFPAFYLVNSLDSTKKKKIVQYDEFHLIAKPSKNTGIAKNKMQGIINQISDTSLSFIVANEDIRIDIGKFFSKTSKFYGLDGQDSLEIRSINMRDLDFLTYKSRSRATFHDIGTLISVFSAMSLLIVSPLVSINYKSGDFDSHKYYTWTGASLAGIAISIPILSLSSVKVYKMTLKNKVKEKKYWYFDKPLTMD